MKEIQSLDELKEIELGIMKKVHRICEENKITYYLCFGTLLGAVRHKGFIPWDDDIDIYMKRRDYQRFIKLFQDNTSKYAEDGIELVNYSTPKYYGRIISKVIDTNTILRETEYKTDDDIGVFVDIWPLDGTPNNRLYRKIYIAYARFLKKLLLAASMNNSREYPVIKRVLIKAASYFDPKEILFQLDKTAKKYAPENSDYLASYNDLTNVYNVNDFRRRILMPFEDTEFWAPANYDSLLRADFDDYMKLPPESERKPHHVFNASYK